MATAETALFEVYSDARIECRDCGDGRLATLSRDCGKVIVANCRECGSGRARITTHCGLIAEFDSVTERSIADEREHAKPAFGNTAWIAEEKIERDPDGRCRSVSIRELRIATTDDDDGGYGYWKDITLASAAELEAYIRYLRTLGAEVFGR